MAKPILPEAMREDIIELFRKGYTRDAVIKFVKVEAQRYVDTDKELMKCISRIEKRIPDRPKKRIYSPEPPKPQEFDPKSYKRKLAKINESTPAKEMDKIGVKVAKHILKKYEKFKKIKDGPEFAGTPFDLIGIRDKKSYIIALKSSLNHFNYPAEIQKIRMQELLRNVKGLHGTLIQLKLMEAEYRIFYDNQMDLLFYGTKMPLGPIEQWIKDRL